MKGGLLAILERSKKGEGDDTDKPPESGEMEAEGDDFDDAASDVWDAVKGDDKEAFVLALRRVKEC